MLPAAAANAAMSTMGDSSGGVMVMGGATMGVAGGLWLSLCARLLMSMCDASG